LAVHLLFFVSSALSKILWRTLGSDINHDTWIIRNVTVLICKFLLDIFTPADVQAQDHEIQIEIDTPKNAYLPYRPIAVPAYAY